MRLINVKAFIEREQVMSRQEERVDCQTEVLEFADDEATAYAILSHRWIGREVAYEEMADLTMMKKDEQDEVRRRPGYQKILDSCEQAQKDGFMWLWVDTCCIDKRSSAELSEAINSMYRWYENSRVCYAYLHDVPGLSFPTRSDNKTYPNSNGWPEWFSRGWTLQEMIAPGNVQFFNKDWKPIGNKKTLSRTLADITRVPPHILTDGLGSNRPCVAQILSWAADRTTTRVEDRAYSLMGLLDVNMPMLYGEGKKAFHRLQLEIIRMSDDQSIFAWDPHERIARTGSFLADDPSFFQHCSDMELMDRDEFIEALKRDIPEEELSSINEDRFGVFPITNRGIQIWLLLRSWDDSRSVLEALLPCRIGPSDPPVAIKLALWKSNHYRYFPFLWDDSPTERTLQFRQVYLRSRYQAQDTQPRDATFEVDDSAVTVNGFTCHGAYPPELTENTLTLTSARPHCVKVYSDIQAKRCFAVGFGQYFDQNWIHFLYPGASNQHSWEGCSFKLHSKQEHNKTLVRGSDHDQSSAGHSPDDCDGRLWVKHTRLGPTWTVRTSCIVRESSKTGVKIEVFRDPRFGGGSAEWTCFDVEVGGFLLVHMHSIDKIIFRKPVTSTVTCGVSCYAIICVKGKRGIRY